MTTRRNNMFWYRGAHSALSLAIKVLDEFKSVEKAKHFLESLCESYLNKSVNVATDLTNLSLSVDSVSVFTFYYYVTVDDNKYKLLTTSKNNTSFNRLIFWNDKTNTNYIFDFTGNFDKVMSFIDSDKDFMYNILKLVGCDPDEALIVDQPMGVYVLPINKELYNE